MPTEQDETVKIVVEVVDKFSKPLDNLKRELNQLSEKGGDGAAKAKKHFDGLRDSVSNVASTLKTTLNPALMVLGVAVGTLGGALAAVVAGLKTFAQTSETLARLSRETGLSVGALREWDAVGRRLGITSAEIQGGFRGIAESLHEIRAGGPLFQTLVAQGLPNLANALRQSKSRAEDIKNIFETLDKIKDPQMRRKFLRDFQAPEGLADATGAERKRLMEEFRKSYGAESKEADAAAKKFGDAEWALQNQRDKTAKQLAEKGALKTLADGLALATEEFDKATAAAFRLAGAVNKGEKPEPGSLADMFFGDRSKDWHLPKGKEGDSTWDRFWQGWNGGFRQVEPGHPAETGDDKQKDTIKKGTTEGVLDAFRFWMSPINYKPDGSGGARVMNASLGGGGSNSGRYSGNRARAAVEGPEPGTGSTRPSAAPPMGNKAATRAPATAGGGTDTTNDAKAVPSDILSEARRVAALGGPGAVAAYMRQKGHPKSGAWCGEFAAAVVEGSGGTPPRNPAVASNWRNFGKKVLGDPEPGDVAVRRGTPTGSTGSHVTIVEGYDSKTHRFTGIGGNQGGIRRSFPTEGRRGYDFYRAYREREQAATPLPRPRPNINEHPAAPRERLMDTSLKANQFAKIEGNASVRIDLNGFPRGTRAASQASGVFSDVELHRGNTLPLASESA
jgi:hypothetical protein